MGTSSCASSSPTVFYVVLYGVGILSLLGFVVLSYLKGLKSAIALQNKKLDALTSLVAELKDEMSDSG